MLPIACVSVSSALGGSEWVLYDFATRAPRHGIAPVVLLPKDGPLGEALDAAGVAVRIAPASASFLELSQRALSADGLTRFAGGVWEWSRAVGAELDHLAAPPGQRPVLLYSNGFKAHLACALLRRYRHAWHLHEFPPERVGPLWRLLASSVPHITIANSAAVARAWRIFGSAAPTVVLNGVDTDRFKPGPRTGWIHDLLALPRDARLVGMPAVFARWPLGHLVRYYARKPVVGSGFGTECGENSLSDWAAFVFANDMEEAERILYRRRIGFVIFGDPSEVVQFDFGRGSGSWCRV